jgi:hypothetical protein
VVGLPDRIQVFDRDGNALWTRTSQTRTLRTFTIGDLFKKHTSQIVALWNDAHSSRLTVLEKDGGELSSLEYAGQLLRVAIGRPTKRHDPKIVVATANTLMLFHVKKLDRGTPVWRQILRSATAAIEDLRILDGNHDNRRDIAVTIAGRTTLFSFDGKPLGRAKH